MQFRKENSIWSSIETGANGSKLIIYRNEKKLQMCPWDF